MRLQFWQSPTAERLPESVRNALVSQFHLEPGATEQLRIVKKSGHFAGRPVRFIQIFDPNGIGQAASGRLKYGQLESGELRDALLFAGYIEKAGQVYLTDQRRSKASAQTG